MVFLRFPGGLAKALTFSYDDGVEEDAELIRILDSHGMKGTFNLNSGLFAAEGTAYPKGEAHRRLTRLAARELYSGTAHEVAVHCLTHASLPELSLAEQVREVIKDRENLEQLFGTIIRGMAYPFGTVDASAVSTLKSCGILYARTVVPSHCFELPRDLLRLSPTCHHDDPLLMTLAEAFLAAQTRFESKLFYVWGHSYEFEANDNWHVIRAFADRLAEQESIWYATGMEICHYVEEWKRVYTSADGTRMHNPTATTFWFERDNVPYMIRGGETFCF